MVTLSKTQVIALFLGYASAEGESQAPQPEPLTAIALLNGPTSAETIPENQTPLKANSGTTCAGNAECTQVGEKCGQFQIKDEVEAKSYCVQSDMCGALGKLNTKPWSLECWADVADGGTPVAPETVDPAAYLTAVEDLITKQTVSWEAENNLIVSPKFNWMDGWFTINTDGEYVEVDKPSDNRCFLDVQCEGDDIPAESRCCMLWPDTNNRRCMDKTLSKVLQTAGPVSFTPSCPVPSNVETEPENAQDDIAAGALADASEALKSFWETIIADRKKDADYDNLSEEKKTALDEEWAKEKAANDKTFDGFKEAIGYTTKDCDDNCKALFEAEILKWRKEVYELCKENNKQITCVKADELRQTEEEARAAATDGNYYHAQTVEQRTAFDKGYAETAEKEEASLTAAWVADPNNVPQNGEEGFACVEDKCEVGTEKFWCCGTSNRVGNIENDITGQKTKVCVRVDAAGEDPRGFTGAWEDSLGVKYQHTCELAQKLVATAAATVATLYALM